MMQMITESNMEKKMIKEEKALQILSELTTLITKSTKRLRYFKSHPAKNEKTKQKRLFQTMGIAMEIASLIIQYNNLRATPKKFPIGGIIAEPNYKIFPDKATPRVEALLHGERNE